MSPALLPGEAQQGKVVLATQAPPARQVPHALPTGLPEALPVQPERVPLYIFLKSLSLSVPTTALARDRCQLSTGSWGPRPDTV